MMKQTISPGVYHHYKGKDYRVITVGRHTETDEVMIVYIGLYDDGPVWIRPLEQFVANVDYDEKSMPRFTRISD